MRLAIKQTVFITLLVSLVLSAGSIVMIQQSFHANLQTAVSRSGEQQIMVQYALKSSLLNDLFNEIPYSDENVRKYVKRMMGAGESGSAYVGVFRADGSTILSSLPGSIAPEDTSLLLLPEKSGYLLRRLDGRYYALMPADIRVQETGLSLVMAYDISYVFQEKDMQVRSYFILNLALVLVAGAASAVLSFILTRPLQKLNNASTSIANGAYHERTRIRARDEIGQLSRSFDKMAQAVEKNVAELERQVESRDRFISAFSHEVKTPTTSIMGYADLLRRAPVDEETQLRYANIVYHEGKRLEAMSHKMLELLHVREEGFTQKAVPIQSFFEKLLESRAAALSGVSVESHLDDATVRMEPDLLFSLLSNLLDNAVKAEPKDNTIRVTGRLEGARYGIAVADTGIGMAPEDLRHAKEIFYMADKSRSHAKGGSGIGLYLCSRIAAIHGSELQIESEPGCGTTASFWLEVQDGEI